MAFEKAKVYHDGSHYIAIPQKENPTFGRGVGRAYNQEYEERKQFFEEAYKGTSSKRRKAQIAELTEALKDQFESEERTAEFVKAELERKRRNRIARWSRLAKKINLGNWNYFCTFTYDDKKHTEESFKKRLRDCFKKMCYRRGWVYIGVWERSPTNDRLHFHGLFNIPDNTMPGELVECRDYSTKARKMQTTVQNSYFTERFGRNDFEAIDKADPFAYSNATSYLMKYIEKSGGRIVYSKNTPAYFISDIMENDVICTTGKDDGKLILFDNFSCFEEGVYMGEVSPEVIAQMKKAN